jgi:hypothetical protein
MEKIEKSRKRGNIRNSEKNTPTTIKQIHKDRYHLLKQIKKNKKMRTLVPHFFIPQYDK